MALECLHPVVDISEYAYDVYKKSKFPMRHRIRGFLVKSSTNEICKILGEKIADSECGIHLKNIGYINVWMDTQKSETRIGKSTGMPILNSHVDGRNWCIEMSTECAINSILKEWSFDFSLYKHIPTKIYQNLKKGNRYKNLISFFKKHKNI